MKNQLKKVKQYSFNLEHGPVRLIMNAMYDAVQHMSEIIEKNEEEMQSLRTIVRDIRFDETRQQELLDIRKAISTIDAGMKSIKEELDGDLDKMRVSVLDINDSLEGLKKNISTVKKAPVKKKTTKSKTATKKKAG